MPRLLVSLLTLVSLLALGAAPPAPSPSPQAAPKASSSRPPVSVSYYGESSPAAKVQRGQGTLRDPARNKDVGFLAFWPEAQEQFPVVLLSGPGSVATAVAELGDAWAAGGYVVIAPYHSEAPRTGDRASRGPGNREAEGEESIPGRAQDLSFLIDSLSGLPKAVPGLAGKLDEQNLAVAGHSRGAAAALLLAGARGKGGAAGSRPDSRPKAFVFLSPPGSGPMFDADSWSGLVRPALFVTGSLDVGPAGLTPTWRSEGFRLSPPGAKHLVFIEGARANSLLGRLTTEEAAEKYNARLQARQQRRGAGARPQQPVQTEVDAADEAAVWRCVKSATAAFLDASLKQDLAARTELSEGKLFTASRGRARVESR